VPRDENNDIVASPYRAPRSLTAAAVRVDLNNKTEVAALKDRRQEDKWQDDAWDYYDLIGEVKYAAGLIANVTSQVRLYPGYVLDDASAPSHLKDVKDLPEDIKNAAYSTIRLLGTGNGGIPGLLNDAALNLFIAGECYLVQEPASFATGTGEKWSIRSVDEVVTTAAGRGKSSVSLRTRRNAKPDQMKQLPNTAYLGRIWRMHPRYSDEADSSMRGLLELMDELLLLNKSARKTLKSRLNAGILYLPDDLSNIAQSDGDTDGSQDTYAEDSDDNTDSFEEELIQAAITPISDEGSASAVVPLIVRGPADLADKIKHITFEQTFDPQHTERADKVMDRILAGLEIPKDIVAGIGDAKYANAVQIEESLYKSHIEPMILLIVDSLTTVFLKPVLRAMGYDEDLIANIVIWYDPSAITTKPSKSESASEGYDKKIISAEAWRRTHGFAESDAPTSVEVAQRIAVDRGMLSEPITEALFQLLIPELMDRVRQQAIQQSPSGQSLDQVLDNNQPQDTTQDNAAQEQPPTQLLEP